MKLLPLTVTTAALLGPLTASGGEALRVWIEHATDLAGPWHKIDLATVPKDPAGNPVLPLAASRNFLRTQILIVPDGAGMTLPLADVPEEHLAEAEAMLSEGKRGQEGWAVDSFLGPDVFPIYDKASGDGTTPAFLEFKVMRNVPIPARPGFLKNFDDDCVSPHAGSLLVSLTDAEAPQQESSQQGLSITERLWELARRRDVKIFRFGADFFAAEDMQGNLLANFGSQPFQPDPELAEVLTAPLIWEGDTELGTDTRPEAPRFSPGHYDSYIDFCNDYLTNPVYRKLRERRAVRSMMERNLDRGVLPEIIKLAPGEDVFILDGEVIHERSLENEDGIEIVRIAAPGPGEPGLKVTGAAPGNGLLHVMHGSGGGGGAGKVTSFAVQVGDPAAAGGHAVPRGSFTPGWQTTYEVYVGTKENQVGYVQMKSFEWPGYVGCGPNAWAILLAWYEREKGLAAAFGNFAIADAPAAYFAPGDPPLAHGKLKPVVHQLRTYCGTFDDPFSDASPTMPGEMPDGVLTYLNFPFMAQMLNYGWKARWSDLFQTLNGGGGAIEVREALQKGRCACVGLGNYWHYAVAYGYRRQEYVLTPGGPPLHVRRHLRCNMGWGNGDGNWKWRDFYDTFFSMNLRLSKGPLHP